MHLPDFFGFDLETLSLKRRNSDQILQLSLVFENPAITSNIPVDQLSHYTVFVDPGYIQGEVEAIVMNEWILKEIQAHRKKKPTKYPVLSTADAIAGAIEFINRVKTTDKPFVVGANVSTFDLTFMPEEFVKQFHYRAWEIGSAFGGLKGPVSLAEAKAEMGLSTKIWHDARCECMDYILLLRSKYFGGDLTPYQAP